jgi:hypothetical protein
MLLQLGSGRRGLPKVGLYPRVRFSTDSSPQESGEEAGDVEGHLHPGLSPLGSPDMASFASFADSDEGSLASFHRQPSDGSDDREAAPNPSQPSSSHQEDFRRLHSLQDLASNTRDLHEAGWRPFTESHYEAAWKSFKRHLRSSNVSLDRASVIDVMNYVTLLHKRKLSYSTINLHRSAISMTLANVDGAPLGSHPLITCLVKGVFTKRPPPAKFLQFGSQPQSWISLCTGPFL